MGANRRPRELTPRLPNEMAVTTSVVPWRARASSAGPRGIAPARHFVQTVYPTRHVVQGRAILCS